MNSEEKKTASSQLWEQYMGKYKNPNPIARYLTNNFFHIVESIISLQEKAASILEIGCGPGESTRRISKMLDGQHFEASEFEKDLVNLHLEHDFPVRIQQESVYELQRKDNEFDCILLLEVLEHLDDFEQALSEIFRVSSETVVVSVPNEPLWRMMNILRGKYWSDWGNTPGHINHWSTGEFTKLIEKHGQIVRVYKPIPWTIIHAKTKITNF